MIDFDMGKLFLLALIALVVLGPEKLPVAARTTGAIMRRMRGGWNSVRAEVERELQVAEIRRAARDASEQVASAQAKFDATLRPLREPLDTQALNTLTQSPPPAGNAPPDSCGQIALAQISAAAPFSEPSGQGGTTEDALHDVT
jgi:twin arginine-targeting protein translocase TatB